jgi:hypothetical protein
MTPSAEKIRRRRCTDSFRRGARSDSEEAGPSRVSLRASADYERANGRYVHISEVVGRLGRGRPTRFLDRAVNCGKVEAPEDLVGHVSVEVLRASLSDALRGENQSYLREGTGTLGILSG